MLARMLVNKKHAEAATEQAKKPLARVLRVVESLADEGMALLMVAQEMSFARKVSDRLVCIHAGRIARGDPRRSRGVSNSPRLCANEKPLHFHGNLSHAAPSFLRRSL
jgi:ABC-type histidine transport system ATPase subunit